MPESSGTVGAATPNRTARRREQTRRTLIAAACRIITERGIAGLKVGELTEEADVGRGSFYNHFGTVEELVAAVVGEVLERLGRAVEEIPHEDDPAVAASLGDRMAIRLAYDHPEFARLMVELDHSGDIFAQALIPRARVVVERGIAAGRFVVPDVEVALIMLAGGALALIRTILAGGAPPAADVAHAEAVLIAYGLPRDEARQISRRMPPRLDIDDLSGAMPRRA